MSEKKNEHQPQHPDGPTWCVKCGTFDTHFAGSECRDASKEQAFWRREPEQK